VDGHSTVLVVAPTGGVWSIFVDGLADDHGYRVLRASGFDEATAALAGAHVDLIVVEDRGPEHAGCDFLAALRATHPEVTRVLALAGPLAGAADAIAHAAVYQFLHLPLDPEQACLVVKRGLEARELSRRHRLLSREFKLSDHVPHDVTQAPPAPLKSMRFEKLVYASEKMAEVCHHARIAARTDLPVLIQGETGTGKELLARAIHYNSERNGSPLLVQNCGGVPDALLQSELFGHKRGAFTGAISDRLGLFRAAHGGTVFLDEISEVSPSFQVSLLRFLQEGEVKPLGADQTVSSNVRIISASNRPLKDMVAAGTFRRDLYYRLKGFELELPPLRQRVADIGPLAEFFAAKHAEDTRRRILGLSARVVEKLVAYAWPGNIRELENEIRRLVVLTGDGEYVTTEHLSPAMVAARPRAAPITPWDVPGKTLKDHVQDLEKHLVRETLERCHWNQSKAADELGLSRVGLANKIRRYGLADV
jgi:two-component system, NtrC family, response regulator HupR/HoxA